MSAFSDISNLHQDVHVLHLDEAELALVRNQSILTKDELHRIQLVKSPKRKESFLDGRTVLRLLVAKILEVDSSTVDVGIRKDGSIYLIGLPGNISLSHTGRSAAAVYSDVEVGIDIEEIKPRRDDLYTYILHPDEYHLMQQDRLTSNEATILFWTLKEAVLKARRSGLRHSPKDIRLDIDVASGDGRAIVGSNEVWNVFFENVGGKYQSVAFK